MGSLFSAEDNISLKQGKTAR